MLDMFNTKKLSQAQAALANTQAQLANQAKKTKTAAIIGSSTTAAAAVVAGVLHFGLGRGNKKVKEKINNYDQIVEERNKAIDDAAGFKTRCEYAENLAVAADGCCQKLANSIRTKNSEEMHAAMEGHKAIHKEIFGDISEASFNAAVAAYDAFVKSLQNQNAQNDQNDQNQIPQNNQNAQNDQNDQNQIPQNNQNAQNDQNDQNQIPQNDQNAQKIALARRVYGEACAKAGAAKMALDTAKAVLDTAKSASPEADVKDLEAAVNTAKATFDAANKELEEAYAALNASEKVK